MDRGAEEEERGEGGGKPADQRPAPAGYTLNNLACGTRDSYYSLIPFSGSHSTENACD